MSSLDDAISSKARSVEITVSERNANAPYFEALFPLLDRNKGNCDVYWNIPLNKQIESKVFSTGLKIQGSATIEEILVNEGCRVKWNL
jgi:hypothetical protein